MSIFTGMGSFILLLVNILGRRDSCTQTSKLLLLNGNHTVPNMSQAEVRSRGRRVCVERKQA